MYSKQYIVEFKKTTSNFFDALVSVFCADHENGFIFYQTAYVNFWIQWPQKHIRHIRHLSLKAP
jgi:hypothetical protein